MPYIISQIAFGLLVGCAMTLVGFGIFWAPVWFALRSMDSER